MNFLKKLVSSVLCASFLTMGISPGFRATDVNLNEFANQAKVVVVKCENDKEVSLGSKILNGIFGITNFLLDNTLAVGIAVATGVALIYGAPKIFHFLVDNGIIGSTFTVTSESGDLVFKVTGIFGTLTRTENFFADAPHITKTVKVFSEHGHYILDFSK